MDDGLRYRYSFHSSSCGYLEFIKNMTEKNLNLGREWIMIARKYMPEMTHEQEQLIMDMANCKKYNGPKFPIFPVKCLCTLCLRLNILELNQKFTKENEGKK